jgi:aminomethyltransferase
MPISYRGALEEHRAVRERCGLFDVSHMGEIEIRGAGAAGWCDRMTVNDVRRLRDGAGQYSILCDERGGVIDDLIVYRLDPERFLLVVNAANTEGDLAWLRMHGQTDVEIVDRSAETGLLALQGPRAASVLGKVAGADANALPSFGVRETTLAGIPAMVSRTGYTGEDGFEVFVASEGLVGAWDTVLGAVERVHGLPCGLAARDSLRLEAALPLCGTDMDRSTTPLEAGLGWVVKLDKPDFIGRAALSAQRERGVERRLVGFQMDDPGVPRHGQPVLDGDMVIGRVTSGTRSPTLGTFIGMAYVPVDHTRPGTKFQIDVRGRRHAAHVVQRPFYRRPR